MKVEPKAIEWLEAMVGDFNGKDVECVDTRGPISVFRIHRDKNGVLVTIKAPWWATYEEIGWVKQGTGLTTQYLNPKVELIDGKSVRLTSGLNYCVIFFGYENIRPQESGTSARN